MRSGRRNRVIVHEAEVSDVTGSVSDAVEAVAGAAQAGEMGSARVSFPNS